MIAKIRSAVLAWMQLLRAPNLLTVIGDPAAGFLLAAHHFGFANLPALLAAAGASLCFYAAGLILNDLLDVDEDRRERPARPLPSGAIPVRRAALSAVVLAVLGFGLCAWAPGRPGKVAVLLVGAILLYHLLAKVALLGPLAMGLCRASSLLLGAAWLGPWRDKTVFFAAAVLGLYIAAVTSLARDETRGLSSRVLAWLPALVLGAGTLTGLHFHFFPKGYDMLFPAVMIPAILITGYIAFQLSAGAPVPPAIGSLIGALLFVQGAFCAGSGNDTPGTIVALWLIALWPVCRILAMRFYAS